MGQLGYTHFDQHSKNIARFRPEIVKANLLREATSLESPVGMDLYGCTWTRTLARQVVQFSFGYSNCPLNPVFRSTAPQIPCPTRLHHDAYRSIPQTGLLLLLLRIRSNPLQ